MVYIFPNQKKIVVHKDRPQRDFLQIQNAHWMDVNKKYGPYALQLYLYLAKNADGFELWLSQEAAALEAGIKKTTFHKYVNLFIAEGYLVKRNGNIYDFYEVPLNGNIENKISSPSDEQRNSANKQNNLLYEQAGSAGEQKSSAADKEKDIKDKKDNIKDKKQITPTKAQATIDNSNIEELHPVRVVHIPDPVRKPLGCW